MLFRSLWTNQRSTEEMRLSLIAMKIKISNQARTYLATECSNWQVSELCVMQTAKALPHMRVLNYYKSRSEILNLRTVFRSLWTHQRSTEEMRPNLIAMKIKIPIRPDIIYIYVWCSFENRHQNTTLSRPRRHRSVKMRHSLKDALLEEFGQPLHAVPARWCTSARSQNQCTCVSSAGESKRVWHLGCHSADSKSQSQLGRLGILPQPAGRLVTCDEGNQKEASASCGNMLAWIPRCQDEERLAVSVCLFPSRHSGEWQRQQLTAPLWRSSSSQFG